MQCVQEPKIAPDLENKHHHPGPAISWKILISIPDLKAQAVGRSSDGVNGADHDAILYNGSKSETSFR